MVNNLNTVLWSSGVFFSIVTFAIKTGHDLSVSRIRRVGVVLIFFLYLLLLVVSAVFFHELVKIAEPALGWVGYVNLFMAGSMIVWGGYTLLVVPQEKDRNKTIRDILLLLAFCLFPVATIIYLTWIVSHATQFSSLLVGLVLDVIFTILSFFSFYLIRVKKIVGFDIKLGLSMLFIGFYFISSLIFPPKIEEAKVIYQTFSLDGLRIIDTSSVVGVVVAIFFAGLIGYLIKFKKEN